MSFEDVFNYTYFLLLGACLVTGLLAWGRSRNVIRLLTVFVGTTILIEFLARWSLRIYGQNNVVYIFYDLINIIVITIIVRSFMTVSANVRVAVAVMIFALLGYAIDVLVLGRYIRDYSYINCGITIYFCFLSCQYLLDVMQNPADKNLLKTPEFLLAIFILFFYSISLLYWVVFLRFSGPEARQLVRLLYRIFLVSNLIFYSGIGIVFILEKKTRE